MSSTSVLPFVRGVDFSGNYLKDVGLQERVQDMCNLRWLRLNKTTIDKIPQNVDTFSKLEVLSMTHNELTQLHDVTPSTFPSLKVVIARDNKLNDTSTPRDLFQSSELVTLV
jgi:hypothetical protein